MRYYISREQADLDTILAIGDPTDSRKACWKAVKAGSRVIAEFQRLAPRQKWSSLRQALSRMNPLARRILEMRSAAIQVFKQAPHHEQGYRLSAATGVKHPRAVGALCLISGHLGLEIPAALDPARVVLDVEHMEQALGPASLNEILAVRLAVGEFVYISTNVSETPQLIRNVRNGEVDTRSTSAMTASKVIAAIQAGADVVKVGFANLDPTKQDLRSAEVLLQMRLVRDMVDQAVAGRLVNMPLNRTTRYPLCAVFFPEIGIDSHGDRPFTIAERGIQLAADAGWQMVLIDTFEKHTGRRYADFLSEKETAALAKKAHAHGLEFWVAGSIKRTEIRGLVASGVDLICFGGAARHEDGIRTKTHKGKADQTIKAPLVGELLREFQKAERTKCHS